jgi:GH25 family lysozyme M1 (1,4-beta-N-acetylmuramidase)
MKGIDVSNNNGFVYWPSVAGAGYEFAWAKASEGVTFKDSFLSGNLRQGAAAGVTMGAYHYARPDRFTAKDEAQAFAQAYRPRPGDLLPVLDFEVSASKSPQAMSRWALDFLNEYERLTGVRPIIYTYPYFLSGKMDARMLKGELLWYADYSGVGGRFRQAYLRFTTGMVVVAHQYSSDGAVPGVRGRCDLDWASSKARIMKATVPVDHGGYWLWLQWSLGEGHYAQHRPFEPGVRPDVPKTIPKAWWKRRKKFVENRKGGTA